MPCPYGLARSGGTIITTTTRAEIAEASAFTIPRWFRRVVSTLKQRQVFHGLVALNFRHQPRPEPVGAAIAWPAG